MAAGTQTLTPFRFDRSFDEPSDQELRRVAEARAKEEAEAAEAELEALPPTFTEEELEAAKSAARADGYAEGHAEGRAEAEGEAQSEIARALEIVAHEVARLADRQRLANDQQEAALARVATQIMGKLMPVYVEIHGPDEAAAVVRDCMRTLQDAGRLTVRCSEKESDRLRELLDAVVANTGFEGQLRVIPDAELDVSDIIADWGAGGAQRKFEDIWSDISDAVESSIESVRVRLRDSAFEQHAGEAPRPRAAAADPDTHAAELDAQAAEPDEERIQHGPEPGDDVTETDPTATPTEPNGEG